MNFRYSSRIQTEHKFDRILHFVYSYIRSMAAQHLPAEKKNTHCSIFRDNCSLYDVNRVYVCVCVFGSSVNTNFDSFFLLFFCWLEMRALTTNKTEIDLCVCLYKQSLGQLNWCGSKTHQVFRIYNLWIFALIYLIFCCLNFVN